MSIYATCLDFSNDFGPDESEGQAPYRYNGSHILPRPTDERAGFLSISVIPNHIDRSPEGAGPGLHDWLRWDVCGDDDVDNVMQTVLTDRAQVEKIRDTLTQWLERPSGVDE